ncbi:MULTISPECIES: lysis protein [Proteus]|uniref:lysis protein n=1 Tax=Proteus TaxID=583 RepID=UPI000BFD1A88|nr:MULTISPECIES: lysis protein [Proteus]ATN00090.1 lysozyme [Proteus vulgaris]MBJ2108580.1 lysis protein [Proteus terrae]MBJ2131375.1 lysis protein [Proteus terrae]MCO7051676.1 lysis protein [Proteus terrae]MDR9741640.1 lysis protein [Proteus terrae]
MNYLSKIMLIAILCLGIVLLWLIDKNKSLQQEYDNINQSLIQQIAENKDYQLRINRLNQLDNRHLQELVHARKEIDQLRDISKRAPERVYIKAECPKASATSTTSLVNANTARPTDTAIRNYWVLRERIAQSEQIILGLQDYIRQECVN